MDTGRYEDFTANCTSKVAPSRYAHSSLFFPCIILHMPISPNILVCPMVFRYHRIREFPIGRSMLWSVSPIPKRRITADVPDRQAMAVGTKVPRTLQEVRNAFMAEHNSHRYCSFPITDSPESTATATSPATSILMSSIYVVTESAAPAQASSSSIATSPTSSASASASPAPTSHTGAIAGGVVGGVLGLVGLGVLALLLGRRRRRDVQTLNHHPAEKEIVPDHAVGSPANPIFEPLMHGHGPGRSEIRMSQSSIGMKPYVRPSELVKSWLPLTWNHSVAHILEPIRSDHISQLRFYCTLDGH